MKLFATKPNTMNILSTLKAAVPRMAEFAEEKKTLEDRRAKAQAEISEAGKDKLTPQSEAKIFRASNIVTVCDARLARLQSAAETEADQIRAEYEAVRGTWNRKCEINRELRRSEFLTANLRFFDNNERATAERLAGILPLPLARAARAGWNGFSGTPDTPENLLKEIECFINHVEEHSELTGIPIE